MKFGKEIQSQQIPGWSHYYLDYKALKKIIAAANKSIAETNSLLIEVMRPADMLSSPDGSNPVSRADPNHAYLGSGLSADATAPWSIPTIGKDEERGPEFQRSKAMFFFKLERELEKINAFYLQKEAELKLRLANLLSKRRAATDRLPADSEDEDLELDGAEWRAVEEGFRSLDKDLNKLQQFIEINATGFRKILKKWDKRSKSRTKELYLARQVEVQPCFNRQLIAELSDIVATCLLDPSNVTIGQKLEPPLSSDPVFRQQLALEDTVQHHRVFRDLEANLCKAINLNDESAVLELLNFVELSLSSHDYGRTHVMRILWRSAIQAEPRLADTIINSKPFNLAFVDDINGRTSLHEAALAGALRLVNLCIQRGIKVNQTDAYGRTALHYACMNGYHTVARTLLMAGANANVQDLDNETPIIYAIINGKVECVRTLIDSGVAVGSTGATSDHDPLSLSCQHGHIQVALFLLQHGAKSLPNTNGEFPIHLAARDGHADLCRLLLQQEGGYKDVPDKYNEWTPLFHAARHGHDDCVEVLLTAGANPLAIDELGKTPVYHASWFGHTHCTNRLLQAMASYSPSKSPNTKTSSRPANASVSSKSPNSDVISPLDASMGGTDADLDADMIPSLSLPPPIMPFRIYGHNYLDNTFLVQVVLGHPFTSSATPSRPPVHLLPSVARQTIDHNRVVQPMAPSFKLVLTSRLDEGGGATMPLSHSIILPLADKSETFTFQVASLDDLLLEFSVYPTFGSRPIGRAIQAPHALRDLRHGNARVIPILDHRLHLIGEVAFEVFIVTPFSEVALEIGGAVETYWKSTAMPLSDLFSGGDGGSSSHRAPFVTSPSARSPALAVAASHNITLSSLSGEFVHAVVQVTRDLVPVIYSDWNLPFEGIDAGVADVTVDQFRQLGVRLRKSLPEEIKKAPSTAVEWHRFISGKLCTLQHLLQLLPVSYGVSLELRYPNPVIRDQCHLGNNHEPNAFVDSVLRTVYSASRSLSSLAPRRKIVFSSFVPAICTAVNWKQPNYAVFFASKCGVARALPSSPSANSGPLLPDNEESDNRCRSVDAAVQFAKSNNLLGVILNANLLSSIPALIQGIKEHGVILAAFGSQSQLGILYNAMPGGPDTAKIDAILQDGILSYADHALAANI